MVNISKVSHPHDCNLLSIFHPVEDLFPDSSLFSAHQSRPSVGAVLPEFYPAFVYQWDCRKLNWGMTLSSPAIKSEAEEKWTNQSGGTMNARPLESLMTITKWGANCMAPSRRIIGGCIFYFGWINRCTGIMPIEGAKCGHRVAYLHTNEEFCRVLLQCKSLSQVYSVIIPTHDHWSCCTRKYKTVRNEFQVIKYSLPNSLEMYQLLVRHGELDIVSWVSEAPQCDFTSNKPIMRDSWNQATCGYSQVVYACKIYRGYSLRIQGDHFACFEIFRRDMKDEWVRSSFSLCVERVRHFSRSPTLADKYDWFYAKILPSVRKVITRNIRNVT